MSLNFAMCSVVDVETCDHARAINSTSPTTELNTKYGTFAVDCLGGY